MFHPESSYQVLAPQQTQNLCDYATVFPRACILISLLPNKLLIPSLLQFKHNSIPCKLIGEDEYKKEVNRFLNIELPKPLVMEEKSVIIEGLKEICSDPRNSSLRHMEILLFLFACFFVDKDWRDIKIDGNMIASEKLLFMTYFENIRMGIKKKPGLSSETCYYVIRSLARFDQSLRYMSLQRGMRIPYYTVNMTNMIIIFLNHYSMEWVKEFVERLPNKFMVDKYKQWIREDVFGYIYILTRLKLKGSSYQKRFIEAIGVDKDWAHPLSFVFFHSSPLEIMKHMNFPCPSRVFERMNNMTRFGPTVDEAIECCVSSL